MARLRISFVVFLAFVLVSCVPGAPESPSNGPGQGANASQMPQPSATPPTRPGAPQLAILSPLQIDSENGRLYAVAQVNGEAKIAVLNATDGTLLAAWDNPGQLALDAARGRLVVDRGAQGVALLNAATGETQAIIDLPPQDGPPAPQVNATSGQIYAFRQATVHVIDPAIRSAIRSTPLRIDSTVCDSPAGDAPIYQTAYDAAADRLYLSFITRRCIPWVSATLIAYDAALTTEAGRTEVDINTQFLPFNKNVFGTTVSRLGPTLSWAWDGTNRWHEESGDFQGQPTGMAADIEREVIYEAIGETIRIIDPAEGVVTGQFQATLLADGRLAGHDPASDNLYFVRSSGRLYTWRAADMLAGPSSPTAVPSSLPIATVQMIALAPNWSANRTMAAILEDKDCQGGGQLFLMINPATGWFPSPIGDNQACQTVTAVAFSPAFRQDSLLFSATSRPATIARSLDTGRSWKAAETTFPDGTIFSGIHPSVTYATDQTVFAQTTAGLLYRSRDGGRNWILLDQRLDQSLVTGGVGPAIHLFGSYGSRILRSTNGGESWKETGITPNDEPLSLLAAATSLGEYPILYAFTTGGRFARSLDAGATWNMIMESAPGPVQLAIGADVPEEIRPIFLLHERSITSSYDGMASVWASTVDNEAGRFRPTAIAIAPQFSTTPYLFTGTSDGQIIRVRADAQP